MNTSEISNVDNYFVHWIKQLPEWQSLTILDFGCGKGSTVKLLRQEGINCYGADVFYEGSSWNDIYNSELFKQNFIRLIPDDGEIPFEDKFFDVILSSSVFEHIQNKQNTLIRLTRVLKDNGLMYHHFPAQEVIREEHIGIPFVHWLPKGKIRYAYTVILNSVGLGYFKNNLSPKDWAKEKLEWIDKYCFYDTYREIYKLFSKEYKITHREIDYCHFRANNYPILKFLLKIDAMKEVYQYLFRRLGFMAIEMRKQNSIVQGESK